MKGMVSTSVQSAELTSAQQAAFVVPSYQRAYVWPSEAAVQLLDDIHAAHAEGASHYFIGAVMTSLQVRDGRASYELIDGQQRITTLMLMALAFGRLRPRSRLGQFPVRGKTLRLTFAIREQVQSLLGHWAHLEDAVYPGDKAVAEDPYLQHLAGALKALVDRLQELFVATEPHALEAFGEFVVERVQWVNNVMPVGSDLNRQFATMNTSGLQLAQSDILKARLLEKVSRDRPRYDAIWQACENMGNYFERNVRELFPHADWSMLHEADLQCFDAARFPLEDRSGTGDGERLTIARLVADAQAESTRPGGSPGRTGEDEDVEDLVYCRSIISFALLLMHALRIFRARRGEPDIVGRLHDSRLIECFDQSKVASEGEVTEFLMCLWQVRFQFDRWVVKWAGSGETEDRHLLRAVVHLNVAEGRLSRSLLGASNLTQLQSVSYFTRERSAQYWLTPLLGVLMHRPAAQEPDVQALLEGVDNALSLTRLTQKEASFALLRGTPLELNDFSFVRSELAMPVGTAFEHYWFQKLEYVLWRQRDRLACFIASKLVNYRITSKNSIEHVHPQQEEYENWLPDEALHAFGNLVLLSPGENSSYSNQAVVKKWADFSSKPKYDALKLAHIFHTMGAGNWDQAAIAQHEDAMLTLLGDHYAVVGTQIDSAGSPHDTSLASVERH